MPKIRVEIEVPYGEYCYDCKYCGCGVKSYCYLFNKELKIEISNWDGGIVGLYRCDECKQVEVKDEKEL